MTDLEAREYLGKLLGVVKTYCDVPPQIKGEAYRDMAETVRWIEGERIDLIGWPGICERLRAETTALRERLADIARDWSESAAYFHRDGKGVEGNIFDAHATELQRCIALKS